MPSRLDSPNCRRGGIKAFNNSDRSSVFWEMGRQQGHTGCSAIKRIADRAEGEFFAITAEIHPQPIHQTVGISDGDLPQNIDKTTGFQSQLIRRQVGNVLLIDPMPCFAIPCSVVTRARLVPRINCS